MQALEWLLLAVGVLSVRCLVDARHGARKVTEAPAVPQQRQQHGILVVGQPVQALHTHDGRLEQQQARAIALYEVNELATVASVVAELVARLLAPLGGHRVTRIRHHQQQLVEWLAHGG